METFVQRSSPPMAEDVPGRSRVDGVLEFDGTVTGSSRESYYFEFEGSISPIDVGPATHVGSRGGTAYAVGQVGNRSDQFQVEGHPVWVLPHSVETDIRIRFNGNRVGTANWVRTPDELAPSFCPEADCPDCPDCPEFDHDIECPSWCDENYECPECPDCPDCPDVPENGDGYGNAHLIMAGMVGVIGGTFVTDL